MSPVFNFYWGGGLWSLFEASSPKLILDSRIFSDGSDSGKMEHSIFANLSNWQTSIQCRFSNKRRANTASCACIFSVDHQFFLKMGQSRPLFVYFHSFHIQIQITNIQFEQYKLKKVQMVCLGLKPRAVGLTVQTNPLSYDRTPTLSSLVDDKFH